MTDYTKLTDDEVNMRVAIEVMGWRLETKRNGFGEWQGWFDVAGAHHHTASSWSPTTNIAHAWEVVAEVSRGISDGHFSLLKFTTNYRAGFTTPTVRDCDGGDAHGFKSLVEAETAPLAICRAALAAMEAE